MKILILLFILLTLGGVVTLPAQDKSNDTTAGYFLIQASIGNLQEIAMGKLAMGKASVTAIREFAARMVKDHTEAEIKLMQVLRLTGIHLPREATDTPVENLMLKNTSDKDFDKVFVHMMVPDHRQAVQLFEKYRYTGKNAAVKAFAEEILPVLKEHLATIVDIDNNLTDINAR